MNINAINPGKSMPDDFNVVIEISANAAPIKYEFDKDSGALMVDRFMGTSMMYPANYGFVPNTLSGDGDPCDVLVVTPFPLPPGVLIRCRALGVLKMEDDGGVDAKIVAVPVEKLCTMYKDIQKLEDLPQLLRDQMVHFFEHYKDLEKGKWVKIQGWADVEEAKLELENGVKNFK
ncbi:MAG: inorganic diphosphatase [Neisseriaceae bacterium]|nr:inorganic diphosphatase [Neisseriaceae bacterium]MBP6863379.1 inorganic diphosphatase [Neisseriaceae bacterium]